MRCPFLLILLACTTMALGGGLQQLDGKTMLKAPAAMEHPIASAAPVVQIQLLDDLPSGEPGTLWSIWGDGCIAADGTFYFGVGNHLEMTGKSRKAVGHSRLYRYDPATRELTVAVNVRDAFPGAAYAGGKIHARVEQAGDGWIYFATYWGKIPTEEDWKTFQGSLLLRHNPHTGKTEGLGVPVPGQGLPASILDAKRGLIYFCAVYSNDLVVYDIGQRKVRFRGGGDVQAGSRNLILDKGGNAWFGTKTGGLARFDSSANVIRASGVKLPARSDAKESPVLRASTRASRLGIVYGMTDSGAMFAFDPAKETIESLGDNVGRQYTAAMVLSPDEKYIYYAPGAHGSSAAIGTPIVQYDIAARKHKVLAFLNPPANDQLKYTVGGTYCLQISPDGSTLYGAFNGAPLSTGKKVETFGLPCLIVLHIPKEER